MSEEESTFEDTLDRLEKERADVENDYRQRLTALDECVQRLAAATDEVGRATRAREDARAKIAHRARQRLGAEPQSPESSTAAWPAWPTGGGPLRRLINGLMRRLLHDYLEVVDRRNDRIRERLDLLEGVFGDLLEATGGAPDVDSFAAGDPSVPGDLSATAAARSAFACASEALAAATEVFRGTHLLVNAKDAELLQRAASGPLRRMELVFDEFARQQEAMLAQLLGRKQELEALIADSRARGDGS